MCAKRRKFFNLGLFLKITATLLLCVPGTPGFDISSMLSSQKQSISGKLPLPDLKSLVSAETLQKVLQAKALGIPVVSAEVSLPDSKALNELLAKLKPKEGRFDPALLEKLHSSLESINPNRQGPLDMFHRFSHSVDDKTMSNLPTAPTSPATLVLPKRKRGKSKKNKFSAKFRMNQTMVVENPNLANYNLTSDSSRSPFSYITDPNLRNHRLYDWEFETYKNFTHIDQAEDLFADEDHHSDDIQTAITKSGHSENPAKIQAAGNGWVPKMRDRITQRPRRPPLNPKEPLPASYEDLEEPTTSHSNIHEHAVMPPGVFVRFTPEMENSEPKKRPGLRAPLRVSSMENQVYHRNPQNAERRPFYDENNSRPSAENFRPSQPEIRPELSAPVFIDPDQDFFTSTVRNQNTNRDKSSESGNYDMPPFPSNKRNRQPTLKDRENTRQRDRINYNKNEHSNKRNKFYSDEYDEKISRLSTKHKSDRILDQQQSSNERDRERKRLEQSIKKQNYDTNYMSEYLGHTPSSAASDPAMYFDHPESESHNSNNEYSSPGNQLQLFGASLDQSAQQEEQPRPLLADHIYAAGQHHLYHHPYGSHSHQVHYVEDEGGSWYNTFFILGGLVALSALIAFFLPSLLHVSSVGKDVDKIGDVNSDVDLWTEIKGVYKDLVHIVKGDYDYFNKKRYGNNGVNLIYRNEEDLETTTVGGDTIEIPRASRRHDKSKSSYSNSSLAYHFSSAPANSTPSILNSSADSFLGEWAKVQLINN